MMISLYYDKNNKGLFLCSNKNKIMNIYDFIGYNIQ